MTVPTSDPVSIFGLSETQLRPIVEAAACEPVSSFDISVEHEIKGDYGFAAEKVIPTFSYVTSRGSRGRVTIFAKHSYNPDSPEPEQYRFLGLHDVPLPCLYGVLRSPEGRPILFLEYVDTSDATRPTLPPEVHFEFLSLMARFNAVNPSPEYRAWLERSFQPTREQVLALGEVVEDVWEHACRRDLSEPLRQYCSEDKERCVRLRALADRVAAQVVDMEIGLVSGDFSFGNSGRRANGERVVFDVEGIGLGARFMDVAGLVGGPEEQWPTAPYPSRQALAEHYLCEYVRWGGAALSFEQFLAETRALWLKYQIGSMSFGVGLICSEEPKYIQYREEARTGLLQLLEMLDRHC